MTDTLKPRAVEAAVVAQPAARGITDTPEAREEPTEEVTEVTAEEDAITEDEEQNQQVPITDAAPEEEAPAPVRATPFGKLKPAQAIETENEAAPVRTSVFSKKSA